METRSALAQVGLHWATTWPLWTREQQEKPWFASNAAQRNWKGLWKQPVTSWCMSQTCLCCTLLLASCTKAQACCRCSSTAGTQMSSWTRFGCMDWACCLLILNRTLDLCFRCCQQAISIQTLNLRRLVEAARCV